jgi:hypothetical protein
MYTISNSIMKGFILLLFAVLLSLTAWSGGPPTSWEKELVKAISSKLARQMRQNHINDSLGMSHRNNYVVSIYPQYDWLSKHEWVDERGQEGNRMFSEDILKSFDNSLKNVNSYPELADKKTALYVVIVNDWELSLETTIAPTDKITKLDELGARAKEEAFKRLKAHMATVPGSVQNEIMGHKQLKTVYVHLMANILVYDRPDIPKNQVTPKRFTYVSFPESLVRYGLKGVRHIKELGGKAQLIQENIRLFGEHFIAKTDVKLAFNYTIPQGERGKVDEALQKPVRDIQEAPNDPRRSMYDYTNLITDEAKLAHLEQLGKNLREGVGGGVYIKTFFTDYRMPADKLKEIEKYTGELGKNDLAIWIHLKDAAGSVTGGLYFGPGLEARLSKNFLDHTKDFLKQTALVYHKFTSIPLQGLAWVAGGISKLLRMTQIPEKYWDPALSDYNPTLFALYYLGRTTSDAGTSLIAKTIASDADDFGDKIEAAFVRDFADKQYEFAFVTGLWNGVVEELAGVTDAVEMLCHAYTDPPTIDQVNGAITSILRGQAFIAIGTQLKNRYSTDHFSNHQIIHHAGKDVIAVVSLFLVVGEISGAAKVSKAFATLAEAAKVMDLIALSRYAYKAASGIKLYRLGQKATTFFRLAGDQVNTVINLVNEAGSILSKTDLSLLRQVEVRLSNGAVARMTVWMDPTENLKDALYQMKELVKDKYGNKIVELTDDASGAQHVAVDPVDASKLIDEAAELATLLTSLEKKVGQSLWPLFKADFEKSVDMLRKFDSEDGLINSWNVIHDAGYASLRKSPESLQNVNALLRNSNLSTSGLTSEMISRLIKGNRNAGGAAAALDELTEGLSSLINSGTKFQDIGKLATDLEKGSNFAEGAGWIQRYITSHINEFSGKTLIFESTEKVGESIRRVDVKMPDGNINRYFEFKSVSEVPPSYFAVQFVRDMQLSDVTDLGQLKWLFDGKKVTSLDGKVDDFIDALDAADIPQSVIDKFVPGTIKTKDALLEIIENRFNEIFQAR